MSVVAVDNFAKDVNGAKDGPIVHQLTHTKHDTDECVFVTRAVKVDAAGTLLVVDLELPGVSPAAAHSTGLLAAGVWHWMRVRQIITGGTATGVQIGE